ncbi:hypothetical protein E6W36_13965 [Hankyongella ginsenosidimutans]|uniref:Uncharacterized protein n=1 Tax=Hankyongella ginsenosidimutans TaxID=1763828 RepID=A0A4D7CCB1_9SPHN|nr:hypothetical protein [Hankyongella ginsenosidimutans]QCI80212.1 hypothetical protein E6W36_13965 [Hankyongella ginsenosidimutans]
MTRTVKPSASSSARSDGLGAVSSASTTGVKLLGGVMSPARTASLNAPSNRAAAAASIFSSRLGSAALKVNRASGVALRP